VKPQGTCDIPDKTGYADSHIAGITQLLQDRRKDPGKNPRDDD
jgi:hypothetical protein